jgi:hypothetical protein
MNKCNVLGWYYIIRYNMNYLYYPNIFRRDNDPNKMIYMYSVFPWSYFRMKSLLMGSYPRMVMVNPMKPPTNCPMFIPIEAYIPYGKSW